MPTQTRFQPPQRLAACDHGIVYRNDREFCGWPFYCGLWKLPDGDVVTGFKKIPSTYGTSGEISHTKLTVGQGRLFLIRSHDDGARWDPESQQAVFDLADDAGRILRDCGESYAGEAPLDFLDPNVVVMAGALPALLKPNSRAWIRASADGGRSWRKPILLPLCGLANVTGHGPPAVRQDGMCLLGLFLSRVNDWGTPGDLVRMRDRRIVCVYGYRLPPFGLRARSSDDDGRTWGREWVLRDDGGSWDLGYPRVTEHAEGKLMAVYYMNCRDDPIQMNGGVRHIAQTIFTPD